MQQDDASGRPISSVPVDPTASADPREEPSAHVPLVFTPREVDLGGGPRLASLGDIAAGIALEINDPIAMIVEVAGWMEHLLDEAVIAETKESNELRRALHQIRTQGRRCRAITHSLLSFARRTVGRPEAVQINELVMDVVRASEQQVHGKRVTLQARLAAKLPTTRVSPSEIRQVLVNLVSNAVSALDGQPGQIAISTRCDRGYIVIGVSDDGAGVPSEHLSRIFDPFFTTKEVGRGTGLGLSICYGIVRKLGGEITVHTRPGQGTTFRVQIPVEAGRAQEPDTRSMEVTSPPFSTFETRHEAKPRPAVPTTVLVADSEVAFVEALTRRLTRRGLVALAAHSGEEAVDRVSAHGGIDVVVLDVKMPRMDVIETLRRIKTIRPLTEVILLSGPDTLEWMVEGLKLGAFDYQMKPCDATQLVAFIERAKERKTAQEQKILEAGLILAESHRPALSSDRGR
ncbi:MAG: response regulator [Candidatus Riflebacteria bacterium]|nr:response regulator [Candidatus Riflebacteria bacterium]